MMFFIVDDNPFLFLQAENYKELEERINEFGSPNYNYEVIIEPSFEKPWIAGRIRAVKKPSPYREDFNLEEKKKEKYRFI